MNWIQLISIILEFAIVIISLIIALKNKKVYGYTLALTFLIYVIYDLSKLIQLSVNDLMLSLLFFIATLSALFSVWKIYNEKRK
jgi:hypothetical protein